MALPLSHHAGPRLQGRGPLADPHKGGRSGYLVEYGDTKELFEDPKEEYTKQYIRVS
jgi:hypothetical protein